MQAKEIPVVILEMTLEEARFIMTCIGKTSKVSREKFFDIPDDNYTWSDMYRALSDLLGEDEEENL